MTFSNFLWLDYRAPTAAASLFQALYPHWAATKWVNPPDLLMLIQGHLPQFLCFEFDTPGTTEFALLDATHARHPGLPILMLAKTAPADWLDESAFQRGVWDILERSVSASDLNATIEAFTEFCQRRHQPCIARPIRQPLKPHPKTQAARDFLITHFADEVRLPMAAGMCHLSESEFSRCFKRENGQTFSDFVLQLRIQKACELLASGSRQVKHVAFDVGFNDVSYFARAFRRHTGMTPSSYQRTNALTLCNNPAQDCLDLAQQSPTPLRVTSLF